MVTGSANVAAGGAATLEITPASGQTLNVAWISCYSQYSALNEMQFYINDTLLAAEHFDVTGKFNFPESAMYVFVANETCKIRIVNNDTTTRALRINLAGTIEDV